MTCGTNIIFINHEVHFGESLSCVNPFTPKSDQVQISHEASPEILHHTVWRTSLFIVDSDWKKIIVPILTTSLIHFSLKGWENVLFELRCESSSSHLVPILCSCFFFQPGEFVHTIGDAHVYLNHIEALEEQVQGLAMTVESIIMNANVWCQCGISTPEEYSPIFAVQGCAAG